MSKRLTAKQKDARAAAYRSLKDRLAKRGPTSFGSLRVLPSGRIQARYAVQFNGKQCRYTAPTTWDNLGDAEAWLGSVRSNITAGRWIPPGEAAAEAAAKKADEVMFDWYAEEWLQARTLKPRTRAHYRSLLEMHILPTFGSVFLRNITPSDIRQWHTKTLIDRPTAKSHAYSLLRAIFNTAVSEEVVDANPCRIRGASSSRRVHQPDPLSLSELDALVVNMPERHRFLVLLAAWCGLRFGELTELRRSDLHLKGSKGPIVEVRRAVVRVATNGTVTVVIGKPKSEAGVRDVSIPPHLIPAATHHLRKFVGKSPSSLLFPASDGTSHLAPSAFYGKAPKKSRNRRTGKVTKRAGHGFYAARAAIGRSNLRQHDLRHTGAVLAAQTGATLAELMARLGHSTAGAAMRYQHAAQGRDAQIATLLSTLASAESQATGSGRTAKRSSV